MLKKNQPKITLSYFAFYDKLAKLRKKKQEIALKYIFIEQLELVSKK